MALALSAVASSLRVFGSEYVVLQREAAAGLSTEAYYLGKSLAHLPLCIACPFVFLLAFNCFAILPASFGFLYALYFFIYFISAGLAYAVSVIAPRDMAQLIGILGVLVQMMFSGANPTLVQLRDNQLIPYALYGISYVSVFRWSQELFYLIAIRPYHVRRRALRCLHRARSADMGQCARPQSSPHIMSDLYGYAVGDFADCWIMLSVIGFALRCAAYLALAVRAV